MKMRNRWMAPLAGLVTAGLIWQAGVPAALAWQEGKRIASSRVTNVRGSRVGEVSVNEDVALRIRYPAGGYTAGERAERVADRLNELSREGRLRPERLRSGTVNGQAAVLSGDELVITADWQHARANGTTPHRLAHQWRNNLAVAMGGTPVAGSFPDEQRTAGTRAVQEETRTKIVPILTVGSAGSIGIAQVSGPLSRIDDVKAVAQIATDYKDAARIRIMVPVSSENVISHIKRVPQVSVTGVGALRL
jgi:hypothetical protein